MKLIYHVTLRLALVLLPIMALWAVVFYYTMVGEINDESDDSLAEYAETIIRRQLAGRPLPPLNSGSNNSYTIIPLSVDTVIEPYMTYHDEMVWIPEEEDTEPARVLTAVFPDDGGRMYKLTVAMPTFERDDLLSALFWHIVVLYLLLVFTILLATTLIFYRSMQPLYRLLSWLDEYIPGACRTKMPKPSDIQEFNRLSVAIEHAVSRAEEYFEQQKQFIGNASHELQTPLAVIGNRIEWIIDNTDITEEQYAELSKVQHSLSRLVRLNRTLLLLSKIDNRQFPEVSDVDVSAVVRGEIEVYKEIYANRNISCTLQLPVAFVVRMNESLANILVSNLLKNAFLHSPSDAAVTVAIVDGALVVMNDGTGPLDEKRVYDRFYHGGNSGSTGLGLALVSSIGRYYGLGIGYCFENGRHCFSVRWK